MKSRRSSPPFGAERIQNALGAHRLYSGHGAEEISDEDLLRRGRGELGGYAGVRVDAGGIIRVELYVSDSFPS
jgi:hypothetical protein